MLKQRRYLSLRSPLRPPSLAADPRLLGVARRAMGSAPPGGRDRAGARHGLRKPAAVRCRAPHHGRGSGQGCQSLPRRHRALRRLLGRLRPRLGLSAIYLRQLLEIRWRRGVTADYVDHWMSERAYCQVQLHRDELDNPDQRIAEDVRDFVGERARALALAARRRWRRSSRSAACSGGCRAIGRCRSARAHVHVPGFLLWVALALRGVLDLAHARRRPPARAAQLRPAALRGRFPLRPHALPRQRRGS